MTARGPLSPNLDPLVRQLFEILDAEGMTWASAAKRAGYHRQVLTPWRKRSNTPKLIVFRDMLPDGYELKIVKRGSDGANQNG